jgi:hypothetical protein
MQISILTILKNHSLLIKDNLIKVIMIRNNLRKEDTLKLNNLGKVMTNNYKSSKDLRSIVILQALIKKA